MMLGSMPFKVGLSFSLLARTALAIPANFKVLQSIRQVRVKVNQLLVLKMRRNKNPNIRENREKAIRSNQARTSRVRTNLKECPNIVAQIITTLRPNKSPQIKR